MVSRFKLFRALKFLALILFILIVLNKLLPFFLHDYCKFEKFNIKKSIETVQTVPQKSLIVHSGKGGSILQLYDINILFSTLLIECHKVSYTYFNEDGSYTKGYSTEPCEKDKKLWYIVKSIVDEYPGDVEYDSLISKIRDYNFSGENDSYNIINNINSKIENSLREGNVTVKDSSGNIMESIIYKSKGISNCYDSSGFKSYELKDGTLIKEVPFGMNSLLIPFR